MIVQSCMPRWDSLLASTVEEWRYEPYQRDGVAVPVCSAIRFFYAQK